MTVNELLQKLVELAREGKGQAVVQLRTSDDNTDGSIQDIQVYYENPSTTIVYLYNY